jgi:hypothetical protein
VQSGVSKLWTGTLDRLRPGETAEQQAECRRLLQRATTFTARLLERHETGLASPGSSPLLITSLPPDRRKLEAAVTTATANLEPLRVMSQAYS